jgi:hypothetical protein
VPLNNGTTVGLPLLPPELEELLDELDDELELLLLEELELDELEELEELLELDEELELDELDELEELLELDEELELLLEPVVSQTPKSVQAFVQAQPTPGSYGPPMLHQPPTVH